MQSPTHHPVPRAPSHSGFRTRVLVAAALAVAMTVACGDGHGVSGPGTLASITVTGNKSMSSASTQQMVAVGRTEDGRVVTISPTWSVAASGGTINATGMFSAGTVSGSFANTVVATVGLISGAASITVTAGALASIAVTPGPVTLAVGGLQQFVAVGKDASGNLVAFAPNWSVVAGGGTVDAAGIFAAGTVSGTFTNTVKVSNGALSGTATIVVTPGPLAGIAVVPTAVTMAIGGTQAFTAVGTDAHGNPVAVATAWGVASNGGTITAGGLFTAGTATGTFTNTVRATSGALSGAATVIVSVGPLASITVTPNFVVLPGRSTRQFAAVGKDASGNIVGMSPTWSVVNGGGVIDNTGLFTSGSTGGTFTRSIRATSGGSYGDATVFVNAPLPPAAPSPLNAAADFAILASAVSCAASGTVNGMTGPANIGSMLPVIGFPSCTLTGVFSSSGTVVAAEADLKAAWVAARGQACDRDLTGVDLSSYSGGTASTTLPPGTYCFATSAALNGTLVLTGSATDRWTFLIGTTLTAGANAGVLMSGSAAADNVYWAVGSSATIMTRAQFKGNVMARTSITLQNGAALVGRALSQIGAVDMTAGAASITRP